MGGLGLVEHGGSVGSSSTNASQVGTSMSRAASGVRSAAGRENRSSSTLCTSVPRTASTENGSGRRSTVRNRNSSGQVMKSAARLGEIAPEDVDAVDPPGDALGRGGLLVDGHTATLGERTDSAHAACFADHAPYAVSG